MKHLVFLLKITILAGVLLISPSYAGDVEDFLKQIEQTADRNGGKFTYSLETSNDDGSAVVKNLKLSENNDKNTVTIQELLVSKAKKIGDNGFSFDGLVANAVTVQIENGDRDKVHLVTESLSFSDVLYPDVPERKHIFWPINVNAASLKELEADIENAENKAQFNISSISLNGLKNNGGEKFSFSSFLISQINGELAGTDSANGTFTFDGVSVADAEYVGGFGGGIKSFNIGAFALAGVTPENLTLEVDFAGSNLTNLYLAGLDESRPLISPDPVTANVGQLKVALNGKSILGWDGASGNSNLEPTTRRLKSKANWTNIFVDLENIAFNEEMKRSLQPVFELGYNKLSMNINMESNWDLKSGVADISTMNFDIVDAFALDMKLIFSGYTETLARQISQLSNKMQFTTDRKQQEALGLQILALLSGLTVNELSIELEDRSLLNKVLEYQASQQNQDPEQMRGIAGPMVGILLAPFKVPEFAGNLSAALSTFMQGNKAITLALAPSPPVNGAELAAIIAGINAGSTTPAEVLERFNVSVDAQ